MNRLSGILCGVNEMKANLPKSFNQLRKNEQARILAEMESAMDNELCSSQIIWIKMACIILNEIGLDREQITMFVGLWKNMYRKNARIKDKQEQDAFLAAKLEPIFGADGFPEEWVQSLREIGRDENGRYNH